MGSGGRRTGRRGEKSRSDGREWRRRGPARGGERRPASPSATIGSATTGCSRSAAGSPAASSPVSSSPISPRGRRIGCPFLAAHVEREKVSERDDGVVYSREREV